MPAAATDKTRKDEVEVRELKAEEGVRAYAVSIAARRVDESYAAELERIASHKRMKGFREGKAPLSLVEGQYGEQARRETLSRLLGSEIQKLTQQHKLRYLHVPEVRMTPRKTGEALKFEARFLLAPDVPAIPFADIAVERPRYQVAEDGVAAALKALATRHRAYAAAAQGRAAAAGDKVAMSYSGQVDGKPLPGEKVTHAEIEIGAAGPSYAFAQQLQGVKAGDSRSVKVTLPPSFEGGLGGKIASFDVTVEKISVPLPPQTDDALAARLGVKDLKALRAAVRRSLEMDAERRSLVETRQGLLKALAEKLDFPLPAHLVKLECEHLKRAVERQAAARAAAVGMSEAPPPPTADDALLKQEAERRLRLTLAVEETTRREGLNVAEAEVEAALRHEAARGGKGVADAKDGAQQAALRRHVRRLLLEEKFHAFAMGKVKIRERNLPYAPEGQRQKARLHKEPRIA